MGRLLRSKRRALLLSVTVPCMSVPAIANPGDTYLNFYAASGRWNSRSQFSPAGHAFMCVSHHLNSGIKEECYGFNPAGSPLGGPGIVYNETSSTTKGPDGKIVKITNRFVPDYIKNPVSVKVDDPTLRKVYGVIDDWNKKGYHYTDNNCIDFVQNAAQVAGLNTPSRTHYTVPVVGTTVPNVQTPVGYLQQLQRVNQPGVAPDPSTITPPGEPGGISLSRAAAEDMAINLDLDSANLENGRLVLSGRSGNGMKVNTPLFLSSMRLACQATDPYFSLDPDDGKAWTEEGRRASDELWKIIERDLKLDKPDWGKHFPMGLRFRSVSARRDYQQQWEAISRRYANLRTRLVFKPDWLAQTRFGEIMYKGDVLLKELSGGVPTVDAKDKSLRALDAGNYVSAKWRSAGESLLINVDNGRSAGRGFDGNRFWFDLVPRAKSRMRSMLDDDPIVQKPYEPTTAVGRSLKAELTKRGVEVWRPQDPLRQVSLSSGALDLSQVRPTMFVIGHDNVSDADVNGDDPFEMAVADDVNRRIEKYTTAYKELRDLTEVFRLYVAAVAVVKGGGGASACAALEDMPLLPTEKAQTPLPQYHPSEMFYTVASYKTTKSDGRWASWWSSAGSHSGGVSPSGISLYENAQKVTTPLIETTRTEAVDRKEGSSWSGKSGRDYFAFLLPTKDRTIAVQRPSRVPAAASAPNGMLDDIDGPVTAPAKSGSGMLDDIDEGQLGVVKVPVR